MPPEYLTPGVYVEEIPRAVQFIEAMPTSVTAFVGSARKGVTDRAFAINSLAEFTARFGALKTELELGYAVQQFFENGGTAAWVVRIAQRATLDQWRRALAALDKVEGFDLLAIPGVESVPARDEALAYAQSRRAFLILDAPRAAAGVALMHTAEATLPVSADAAVYFPWIEIADLAVSPGGAIRQTAPSGSVAGVMARLDAMQGVWKPPAGSEAVLNGITGLAVVVTDQENEALNAVAVNCLREFFPQRRIIFGARTRAGATASGSEWKYVSVRRFALLLLRSLERGLQWTLFEPNGEPLWARIRSMVESFLFQYFQYGALQGSAVKQAYFVKCDHGTTTTADIASGVAILEVGFAPLKPAEFIVLKIQLKTQGTGT